MNTLASLVGPGIMQADVYADYSELYDAVREPAPVILLSIRLLEPLGERAWKRRVAQSNEALLQSDVWTFRNARFL